MTEIEQPPNFVLCLLGAHDKTLGPGSEWRRTNFDYCAHAKGVNCSAELCLSLLRVSRQVYDEAVSIPSATNTFVIHSSAGYRGIEALPPLAESLVPSQLRAIRNVVLISPVRQGGWSRPPKNVSNIARALGGLKELQLVIKLEENWVIRRVEAHIATFATFERCRLRGASVVLYSNADDVPQSVLDKAKELERQLLMPQEEVQEETRQASRDELARADRERTRERTRARPGLRKF